MDKTLDTIFYEDQSKHLTDRYEFDKAVISYKRLIAMDPKVQRHHYWWARIRRDQEKLRWSELKFREAIILDPQDSFSLKSMGIIFAERGKYDEAISTFQRAITLTKKGDYEEALEWYGIALKTRPFDEKIHNAMGYLCFLQEKYKEAILKFDDAIQNNPHYEMPLFNKAITFFCQSGMEEESKNAFELGIKALTGGHQEKFHRLRASMSLYSSEMDRVRKEFERDDLRPEARVNLEKIQKAFEYILDLLEVEIEKLEDLLKSSV